MRKKTKKKVVKKRLIGNQVGAKEKSIQDHNSDPANTMNAIYTAILVASTLAYSAVAWVGLSIDPTATEDLF